MDTDCSLRENAAQEMEKETCLSKVFYLNSNSLKQKKNIPWHSESPPISLCGSISHKASRTHTLSKPETLRRKCPIGLKEQTVSLGEELREGQGLREEEEQAG